MSGTQATLQEIGDALGGALAGGAKGAAAGMALGPIGAGVGGLIGIASALVPAIFGVDSKPALQAAAAAITGQAGEDAQATALANDPAAAEQFRLQALQIADAARKRRDDMQLQMLQTVVAQQQAQLADVANARQQTVQLAQSGSKLAWAAPVISVVVAVGFFLAIVMLATVHGEVDPGRAAMINILVGALAAGFTSVTSYWLGSSAGSARKTELLAQATALSPPTE